MARRLTTDGDKLRSLREEAWLDQKELAAMAGVAAHTIMRIEKDYTPHPTRATLRKIASALNVHPSELLAEDDPGPLNYVRSFCGPRVMVGVG